MNRNGIILFLVAALFGFTSYAQNKETNPKQAQVIMYKQVDTVKLNLTIFHPENYQKDKEYPAILFFFGGGWVSGSIGQFEPSARYFASRGMIAILADYRIFNKHKTTPFDALKDARSAMRYLRANARALSINPNKIAAAGGSAGGHLAAALDLTQIAEASENSNVNTRPNALVLYNPVYDNGPNGYGYERIGERYPEISPLHNIKKGAAPTIVFFGTKDKWVPVATAQMYKQKMEEVGSRCDLFLYLDQPHGFFNFNRKDGQRYYLETLKESDVFLESLGFIKGKPKVDIFKF